MYDGSGQPVNEAEEYGAPINPTTVRRDSEDAMPIIEPGASTISPVVETTATDSAIRAGRAGQVQPTAAKTLDARVRRREIVRRLD